MNLGMLKLQASEEEGLVGPEDQEDTEDLLGDLGLGDFGFRLAFCFGFLLGLGVRPEVLHFADLRQLTHELKALGAHNLNPGRPGGLTGRARIRALVSAYERYRQAAGLPATYQVVYGLLRKEP